MSIFGILIFLFLVIIGLGFIGIWVYIFYINSKKFLKEIKKDRKGLSNGGCAKRYDCKNVNTPICFPLPKKGKNYVNCNSFEELEN